jgi:hypothetical protein
MNPIFLVVCVETQKGNLIGHTNPLDGYLYGRIVLRADIVVRDPGFGLGLELFLHRGL